MSEMPKTKKIAITGSMGSGKSSVSNYLRKLGYAVFDADAIVHQLYAHDKSLKDAMVTRFGKEILFNNQVSTKRLREFLIEFPKQKWIVEKLVHPRVLSQWIKFYTSTKDTIVFGEIPLLFEVGWEHYFDKIWFVYAEPDIIKQRLITHRNLDEATIAAMLKWQMDPQKKCAQSSFVLYNNTEIKSLYDQIDTQLLIV
jgi:dephospho-CoA kinase